MRGGLGLGVAVSLLLTIGAAGTTAAGGDTRSKGPSGSATAGGDAATMASPVVAGVSTPAGTLAEARSGFSATLLGDGRVLVVGGWREDDDAPVASAEVWDPAKRTFEPAGDLAEGRAGHDALLLPDGRVLVVGGWDARASLASAELWDPATRTFGPAGSLSTARSWDGVTTTRLADGRVIVVGGRVQDGENGMPPAALPVEIWEPSTGTFRTVGQLPRLRIHHSTLALPDGSALIVGGHQGLRWDPVTEAIQPAGRMTASRSLAVLLPDGRALTLGYDGPVDCQRGKGRRRDQVDSEVWDPASRSFSPAGRYLAPRRPASVTILQDGDVLVYSGYRADCFDSVRLDSAELWRAESSAFEPAGRTALGPEGHSATLLEDGRVSMIGGWVEPPPQYQREAQDEVVIFDPRSRRMQPAGTISVPRAEHTATLLADGSVLLIGGNDGPETTAETWMPPPTA